MTKAPSLKLQFERLDYQEQAVQSVCDVFKDINFKPEQGFEQANPQLFWHNAERGTSQSRDNKKTIEAITRNLEVVRTANGVDEGELNVGTKLVLDVLMETGTGKTFTFIESIYRLNKLYSLSKFLILVPSTAIRQGTLKNLQITKEFFSKIDGYRQLSVFEYTPENVFRFANASSANISVMISTYQAFNKASNVIHKKAVEQGLPGINGTKATSYMQAIAALRPVIIIDEPHRFEGKNTAENIDKFNPLFTLRFGATFKNDSFQNLLYTLDSVTAFRKGLVKSITVDTIGNEQVDAHSLTLIEVKGAKQTDYVAHIRYKDLAGKTAQLALIKGDNLGEKAAITYLNGYVIELISKSEVVFTNGFSLPLGEDNASSYGVLLDEIQTEIIHQTIKTHFEKEAKLFDLGIKSLTLFFIDSVGKYLLDSGEPGILVQKFEKSYAEQLQQVLSQPNLSPAYRAYLERTKNDISKVHQGYFAKSNKDKDLASEIDLILNQKEKLLSTETDLRFIFSMWALQEGWDNPNIFTLCKLAPSNSKITKLQQIGRGLRLAVNQQGQRITSTHDDFDFINELNVIVPSTEGDFVKSIQDEIAAKSLAIRDKVFDANIMISQKITPTTRQAVALIDIMESLSLVQLDDDDKAHIIVNKNQFKNAWSELLDQAEQNPKIRELDVKALAGFFNDVFMTETKIRSKDKSRQSVKSIKVNAAKFNQHFKTLWENLNRDAELVFDLDSEDFIKVVNRAIVKEFTVSNIQIQTTRHQGVETGVAEVSSTYKALGYHSVFNLYEFVRALAGATQLSFKTIASLLKAMSPSHFDMIALNENLAFSQLKSIILRELYALIINKISYNIKEIRPKATSLTNAHGMVYEAINKGSCGKEDFDISSMPSIRQKSLFDENFIEVDSEIEEVTISQSTDKSITVFAKLPKINIPVPNGKYNPDFGYVIESEGQKTLYLVVETKGYDSEAEISTAEQLKIAAAKVFFKELKALAQNIDIHYRSKINNQQLVDLLAEIQQSPVS